MSLFRCFAELLRLMQTPRSDRRLVFFSEGKSSWPHLEGLLHQVLERGELPVCYISSAADDPGLVQKHPQLRTFVTDSGALRNWLFANLEADVLVMTTPELGCSQLKRSRHPVHYVYVQHSLVSLHMIYRPGAFDHFDTVFCAGPHHIRELRAMEEYAGLPAKKVVEHGYGRLDGILAEARGRSARAPSSDKPVHVLMAPSWGPSCIIESCGARVIDCLLEAGFRVTLRPHPQTLRLSKSSVDTIVARHGDDRLFDLDLGIAGRESLFDSDVMLSDWSGAALDYAFGLGKPVVFLDVAKKINNPEYLELKIVPIEESIRERVGSVVPCDDSGALIEAVHDCACRRLDLDGLMRDQVFNVGASDGVGADAILDLVARCAETSR